MPPPAFPIAEIARHLPVLGVTYRWLSALRHVLAPCQGTYSQHGEDAHLLNELIRAGGGNLGNMFYVDIGASHPTRLSNTYLLYRHGAKGIVIEPNMELLRQHKFFRKRDIHLPIGCGSTACLGRFHVAATPVLSSFCEKEIQGGKIRGMKVLREEYVPILPLDAVMLEFPYTRIDVLSIDTEGLDLEVLKGARETLKHTMLLVVEANSPEEEEGVMNHLAGRFVLSKKCGCNLILKNASFA